MSDEYIHDDNLVVAALRLNWDHARHVEMQRLYLLAIYAVFSAALGYLALHGGDPFLRVGAILIALCVTAIIWSMTHKLGRAFATQVWHADRCARRLVIQPLDGSNEYVALHGYIGFPRKPPALAGVLLTVRLMFDLLYGTLAGAWVILFGYLLFRFVAPAAVL